MSESYSQNSIEGFFRHSYDSGGDYSLAGNSDCFMVRWKPDDDSRMLVVRTIEDAFSIEAWLSRGITCYASEMPFWERNRGYLVVECENPDFFPVMNRISANLIQKEILSAQEIIRIFREERTFWSGIPVSLTTEAAAGLFGELFFMFKHFKEEISDIIENRWSGANYSDKDFNWDELQIEVKTSLSTSNPTSHTVSSLHQLQEDGRPLVLFSIVAHPDEGGNFSLNDIVHCILDEISGETRVSFLETLDDLGYILGHPQMDHFRYNLTHGEGTLYAVIGDFPRLTVEDNPDDNRIDIGSYRISMAKLDRLVLDAMSPFSVKGILEEYHRKITS